MEKETIKNLIFIMGLVLGFVGTFLLGEYIIGDILLSLGLIMLGCAAIMHSREKRRSEVVKVLSKVAGVFWIVCSVIWLVMNIN